MVNEKGSPFQTTNDALKSGFICPIPQIPIISAASEVIFDITLDFDKPK